MDFKIEKHEPASINKDCIPWIEISKDGKYNVIEDMPDGLNRINRYIIEQESFKGFVQHLSEENEMYLCLYLNERFNSLTKVQKLIKEKFIIKENFIQSTFTNGLFYKKMELDTELDIVKDFYYNTLFIFNKNELNDKKILEILTDIDFFNQPVNFGSYYPTPNTIFTVEEKQIGIIYLKRAYQDYNDLIERDVFVCYFPVSYKVL